MVAGNVGQKGGAVQSRALAHGRQDGRRRVRRQGGGMFGQADWGAKVALVRGDGGVERWRDESGWFVRGDNERLRPGPALEFGFFILVQSWIGFLILERRQIGFKYLL